MFATRSHFSAGLIAGLLTAGLSGAGQAVPPPVALKNLQPVTADAPTGGIYDPTAMDALLSLEPMVYPELPYSGHRMTVDLEFENTGTDYLRLDELYAHTGYALTPVSLTGNELLSLPESVLTVPLGSADLRRPVLSNGAFSVTGLKIEQRLEKTDSLRFGTGLDVIAYSTDLPMGRAGYVVAGSHEYLIGDAPTSADDWLPSKGQQGFVALYDSGGSLRSNFYTWHEEVSALFNLEDGQVLVAGRYRPTYPSDAPRLLLVNRMAIAEIDDGGNTVDLGYFDPDKSFGNNPDFRGTMVEFHDGEQTCDVRRVTMITTAKKAELYVFAAELACGKAPRVGIAVMNSSGKPLDTFGSGGMKVYSGPLKEGLVPVGIAEKLRSGRAGSFTSKVGRRKVTETADWVWLGTAFGDGCVAGTDSDACEFALNAFDPETGKLESEPWYRTTPQSAVSSSRPHDFALDTSGRPVMAGSSFLGGSRFVSVHRFKTDGSSDWSFGLTGWYTASFQGHEAEARAVRPAQDGSLMLAVMSVEQGDSGTVGSIAMQQLMGNGVPGWDHSPFVEQSLYMHQDINAGLNYGYLYEQQIASWPSAGLIEDWEGRFVFAGQAFSEELLNPCEANAVHYGDPMLDIGSLCGGPGSVLLARYLPFGEPDSRRWVPPGATRRAVVPEDRDLGPIPPSAVNIGLVFDGYTPFLVLRGTETFSNAIWSNVDDSYGSYRFPYSPTVLNYDERFFVKAHTLDHHHRNSTGNRFAYDITIKRWTGSHWVSSVAGGGAGNANSLIWKRPVRAVAGGKVVACRRSAIDTTPGQFDGKGANFVKVQHAYDAFDASRQEFISYLHFAQDTVPESICPDIDGADPDGAELPEPVEIKAGQLLGLTGSSGNSSGPHLHIHLETGADAEVGPAPGVYPLLFHDVRIQSENGSPDDPSWLVDGEAIAHGSLAYPIE